MSGFQAPGEVDEVWIVLDIDDNTIIGVYRDEEDARRKAHFLGEYYMVEKWDIT